MGISITLAPKNVSKVLVNVPTEDIQKPNRQTLTVTWNVFTREQQKEFLNNAGDMLDINIVEKAVVNIKGFVAEDGQPVEYSADLLKQVMQLPYVADPLVDAAAEYVFGNKIAEMIRSKN